MRALLAAATAALTACATTATAPVVGEPVAFVSCPILRDTSTVGCWLSEYEGELYYLGISVDQSAPFDPPSLGHRALVEGVITDKPRVCGGIPIEPVHVSVLERDASCNAFLPADPRFEIGFAPPRGPGPREKRQGERRERSAAAPADPLEGVQTFVVHYDFNRERAGLYTRKMAEAMRYAELSDAKRVSVHAYRASVRLIDGSTFVEDKWIAERRANTLAETLVAIGVDEAVLEVDWTSSPVAARGAGQDAGNRRATITVWPSRDDG